MDGIAGLDFQTKWKVLRLAEWGCGCPLQGRRHQFGEPNSPVTRSSRWRRKIYLGLVLILFLPVAKAAQPPAGVRIHCAAEPKAAAPGTVVDLAIEIELPPGWITYDLEQVANSVMPTRITLDRSDDFAPLQGYSAQIAQETRDPVFKNRVVRYFSQSPTFHRPILLGQDLRSDEVEVTGRIDFQVLQPSTGRYYVIQQSPFRTVVSVRRDSDLADPPSAEPEAASPGDGQAPVGPPNSVDTPEKNDARHAATALPTWTHKPIVIEEEILPEAPVKTADVTPLPVIEPQRFAASTPSPEEGKAALPEPKLEMPVIAAKDPSPPTASVFATESPAARAQRDIPPIRNASAIVVEVEPGDLEIPFETTFGSSETLVFDWSSFDKDRRSLPILPLAYGVLLGLFLFASSEFLGESWKGTGARLLGATPLGVVVGLYPWMSSVVRDPFLASLSLLAAFALFRKSPHATLSGVLVGTAPYAMLALTLGAVDGHPLGPLFGLIGFSVGGLAVLVLQGIGSPRLSWLADRLEIVEPPGYRMLVTYGLLALGVFFLGRADFADQSSDWIGYRGVLGTWCALAALVSLQSLFPLAGTVSRLQERPERSLLLLVALALTIALASHLCAT